MRWSQYQSGGHIRLNTSLVWDFSNTSNVAGNMAEGCENDTSITFQSVFLVLFAQFLYRKKVLGDRRFEEY